MHNSTPSHTEAKPPFWLNNLFLLSALSGVLSAVPALFASLESLWLDELHSSWTIGGSLSEVAVRAREGNQGPLFFWGLFAMVRTLGQIGWIPDEVVLRFPSVLAWSAIVTACVWHVSVNCTNAVQRAVAVSALVVWLNVDRIQLFYATEARVYEWVGLLNLLAWMCIGRFGSMLWSGSDLPSQQQKCMRPLWCWCGLAAMMVHVHLLSILAIAWQVAVVSCLVLFSRRCTEAMCRQWWLGVFIATGSFAVAWAVSSNVWEHRQRWESFAGETSFGNLISLFPLLAYGVTVALAGLMQTAICFAKCCTDWFARCRTEKRIRGGKWPRANSFSSSIDSFGTVHVANWWFLLWAVATIGPWALAWLITATEVAPVFHRRYVIVSGIPLVLLAVNRLIALKSHWLRVLAALGVAGCLVFSQGTWAIWNSGYVFGWLRGEDWRSASRWVEENVQPGDEVWCAAYLIEGRDATWPLTEETDSYLSFPLRGCYQIQHRKSPPGNPQRPTPLKTIVPHALVGHSRTWVQQIVQRTPRLSLAKGAEQRAVRKIWIVNRGSARSLKRQIGNWTSKPDYLLRVGEPKPFGAVSVVDLELEVTR